MTVNKQELVIRDCGLAKYGEMLELQKQLLRQRQQGEIANTVLLVEHPAVITLGARDSENKLLCSEQDLSGRGVDVEHVRRGGGTTAHNPGQIVFYPVLHIKELDIGVNEYIRDLEAVGIELLGEFGVSAERRKGYPGLWIERRKIASIGVEIKRWVTMHGMAINVSNDLSIFDAIVPCGIEDVIMTSVQKETGKSPSMGEVKQRLARLCIVHWSSGELARYEEHG